jgi:hypothetical protein
MPSLTIPSPDVPPPLPFNSKKKIFNYLNLVQGNNHNTATAAAATAMTMTTTTNTITTTREDKFPQDLQLIKSCSALSFSVGAMVTLPLQ